MAARNKEKRAEILQSISNTYPNLISIPITEDINEVLLGLPSASVTDEKLSTCVSSTLKLDSVKVKDALAKLATIVSKNSGAKFDTEGFLKQWTSLLLSAE